jgi:hypothetical protein
MPHLVLRFFQNQPLASHATGIPCLIRFYDSFRTNFWHPMPPAFHASSGSTILSEPTSGIPRHWHPMPHPVLRFFQNQLLASHASSGSTLRRRLPHVYKDNQTYHQLATLITHTTTDKSPSLFYQQATGQALPPSLPAPSQRPVQLTATTIVAQCSFPALSPSLSVAHRCRRHRTAQLITVVAADHHSSPRRSPPFSTVSRCHCQERYHPAQLHTFAVAIITDATERANRQDVDIQPRTQSTSRSECLWQWF